MATIKELQEQKDKNSAAWHNATTQEEKDRLHQENIKLQNQIDSMTGGSSSFNSSTGKWTTSTQGSGSSGSSSSRPASSSGAPKPHSTGAGGTLYASQKNNAWVSGVDDRGETDYSVLLQQAMQQGASAQVVQNLLDQRTQKAQQNGYTQYMYDDVYGAAMDYIRNAEAEVPYSPNYMGAITDNSDYLNQMYEAQKRAALAQINNAYQQNVNAINRAGEGVDTRYQNARNQAAGASELAARNFNEYAAASGLNSGAGGQAELARNVALQNSLGDIDVAEAQTYADLEQQMADAEVNYNNAIAEAEANGDAALAAALYQEKVRVQEATLQAMMQQYQDNLTANQLKHQWQQDDANTQLANRQQLAQYGTAWLENGVMPSQEMLDAMGITAQDAQAFLDQLSLRTALEAQRQQSSGNGGNSSGNGVGELSFSTAKSLAEAGYFDDAVLNTLRANGMADAAITAMYGWKPDPAPSTGGDNSQVTKMTPSEFRTFSAQVSSLVAQGKTAEASQLISQNRDRISDADAGVLNMLLRQQGV